MKQFVLYSSSLRQQQPCDTEDKEYMRASIHFYISKTAATAENPKCCLRCPISLAHLWHFALRVGMELAAFSKLARLEFYFDLSFWELKLQNST